MHLDRTSTFASASEKQSGLMPWVVCFCSSLFFFYEFIQGNMFASIADNIMLDFNIHVDRMAYLSSVYYVSNVVFLFIAGQLLDRFSPKKIMTLAMSLCVLSTFWLSKADSFTVALICRFITGIGSAFCLLGPVRIASRWFLPQQMAMVTGIIVTIAMVGGMVAQYPMTLLVSYIGWRDAVCVVGCLGIIMLIAMIFGIIDKPKQQEASVSEPLGFVEVFKRAYTNPEMFRVALFASLMNMSIAVFGAMLGSLYLMERLDVSKELASSINGMLFFGTIIGGPLMGRWSDRMGIRLLPMRFGALGSLFVLACILYLPITISTMYVLFFLLGILTSAQVISYAYVAESQPHSMTAAAVSLVSICTQSGYVIFQNLFSHLLIWHRSPNIAEVVNNIHYQLADYQYASIILPLGLCTAFVLLIKLKETYCKSAYTH